MNPLQDRLKEIEEKAKSARAELKIKPIADLPASYEPGGPMAPEEQKDVSDTQLDERNVSMSNALTRSAHGLNLTQKRIIALALAKTDSKPDRHLYAGTRVGWMIQLTAKDYANAYDVSVDKAYEQLKEGAKGLLRALWKTTEQTKRGQTITQGQWLSLAQYHEGEGKVDIVFHPHVAPHLLGLKYEFTTYKLKQTAALRSIYSWRLYECLMSWKTTGQWTVSVEEFRKLMEIEKYQNDFGKVVTWIINPAIKELKAKNNLIVSYEKIKAGVKVAELEFKFYENPQGQLPV